MRRRHALSVGLALLVIATTFTPQPSLRDAVTRTAIPARLGSLERPLTYVLLAPVCDIFDAWSLLDLHQHVAFLASLVPAFIAWRVIAARRGTTVYREIVTSVLSLVALAAVIAVGALVPRPMARLVMAPSEQNWLLVDFHSHTSASHDGRPGFDAEANREWHRESGFHAAYVTDHVSFAGALAGLRGNPPTAAGGTVLLSGLEVRSMAEHLNYIGFFPEDTLKLHERERLPRLAYAPDSTNEFAVMRTVVLQTIPIHDFRQVIRPRDDSIAPLDVFEANDGAPKGLSQLHVDRTRILALADSLHLAPVAGSDNHGWGFTAVAWTALSDIQWQGMAPRDLDRAIRARLVRTCALRLPSVTRDPGVIVIERFAPDHDGSILRLALTTPLVVWRIATTLTIPERIAWCAYLAVLALGPDLLRRKRS